METQELPPAGGKGPVILSAETYEEIRRRLGMGFQFDPRDFEERVRDGKRHLRLRPGSVVEANDAEGHPFKIYVVENEGLKLQVRWGEACGTVPTVDSAGNIQLVPQTQQAVFDSSTALVGDPDPPFGTVGQASLDADESYGVWLKTSTGAHVSTGYAPPRDTASDTVDALHLGADTAVAEVLVTADYPDYDDIVDLVASTENFIYRYIGKVVVDEAGLPTVQQWLRSNVQWPGILYPKQIISTDVGNEIVSGSDGGVFYEAP